MLAVERHQKILQELRRGGRVDVPGLVQRFGVSALTIRRDLNELAAAGRLVRTHGGATLPDFLPAEPSFNRKRRDAVAAKAALAGAAVGLAAGAGAVYLDAGTTTLEIGRALLRPGGPMIFTNSIPLLLEPAADGRVVALGGTVRSLSLALTGAGAVEWLERLEFDCAFLGASGVDLTRGPSTTEPLEAEAKRAALRRARRRVLVLDGTKWTRRAPLRFAAWDEFTDVLTDQLPPEAAAALTAARVAVHHPRAPASSA